jgi:hypothetical protein
MAITTNGPYRDETAYDAAIAAMGWQLPERMHQKNPQDCLFG